MAEDNQNKKDKELELLKSEIDLLKEVVKSEQAEREILKKELADNKKNDDQRHEDIKQIQKEHHRDNLKWNKFGAISGAISTPLTLIFTLVGYWMSKSKPTEPAKEKKPE